MVKFFGSEPNAFGPKNKVIFLQREGLKNVMFGSRTEKCERTSDMNPRRFHRFRFATPLAVKNFIWGTEKQKMAEMGPWRLPVGLAHCILLLTLYWDPSG